MLHGKLPDLSPRSIMNFDYVIAGAGSAGSVLASRLSEDPATTVLLLEAGGPGGGLWERIPLGVGKLLNDSSRLWRNETEPSGAHHGKAVEWVSGRSLGGSSAVNGMLFVRGHPAMYDKLAADGCAGWSYAECLPYFRKLEDCSFGAAPARGRGGPIGVARVAPDPLSAAFLAGCADLGYPLVEDYNDAAPDGASYVQLSLRNGQRCGAADGYLRPARRRANLTVITGATARKILFTDLTAIGIEFAHEGKLKQAHAAREVLVCTGAVRSPQLLELSGLGRQSLLAAHGIRTLLDQPAIGENLQDHLMARICYETPERGTINHMLGHRAAQAREALRYLLFRAGMFATASLTATSFVRSTPELARPDLRIQIGLLSASSRIPAAGATGIDPGSAFHIGVYGLYPQARGSVHIQSNDIAQAPRVMPNYLDAADDRRTIVAGLQLIRKLSRTAQMRNIITREIRPASAATDANELLEYAKQTGSTCWHPVGTCRMGDDAAAVVDTECRVHGVRNLRVVDASVFPCLTSSNTNVPVMMLAERAADLIRHAATRAAN